MAKKKTRPPTPPYSVTKSGAAHKRRKHPVRDEDARLREAAAASQRARAQKRDQRKRRAAGRSTPEEQRRKKVLLGADGKFKKGNPGKEKGTKDHVPGQRTIKISVRDLIEEVVRDNPKTIRGALKRGLSSGASTAHLYLKLSAEYLDGRPVDTININSQYKQDELEHAKRSLGQQLTKFFKTHLANSQHPPHVPPQS